MLVHALVLQVRFPTPLVCIVPRHQFLSPFDPARSKCILCQPNNAPVVLGLYNIFDSFGLLPQLTDYVLKRASARAWTYLRVQTFLTLNFLHPIVHDYYRGDFVKGFVHATVVWKM